MNSIIINGLAEGTLSIILTLGFIRFAKTWITDKIKGQIKHEYDAKLEILKTNLSTEHDKNLELLKNELKLNQMTFSKLQEERATVIKNTYSKLEILWGNIFSLTSPLQLTGEASIDEKDEKVVEAGKDFITYFSINKIFFEKQLCEKIDEVSKIMSSCRHWFIQGHHFGKDPVSSKSALEFSEWKVKSWEKLEKLLPPLKSEIEDHFRKLLGVN